MKPDKPLVCVVWDDAHGIALGDYSEEEVGRDVHKPVRYYTYGLLVREDADGVTLACEWSDDGGIKYRNLSFIPTSLIKQRKELRRGRRTDVRTLHGGSRKVAERDGAGQSVQPGRPGRPEPAV